MSDITVSSDGISAIVFGNIIKANNPTELFVCVISEILKTHPEIIGKKETHFTSDKSRADKYTGTTRQIFINGTKVYIKTGFSTKDKIDGIKKTCQLAGVCFSVKEKNFDGIFSDDDFFKHYNTDTNFNTSKETSDNSSDISFKNENFDLELNFAFHSEYYLKNRSYNFDDYVFYNADSARVTLENIIYHNGSIYITKPWKGNEIYKILPDKTIKAIVSSNKNFKGAIAVNRHGIFRINNGHKIYLFGEDGCLKGKAILKPNPAGIYIYDNYIYAISLKGYLYQYNIFDSKNSPELIWKFSDSHFRMCDAFEKYFLSKDTRNPMFRSKAKTTFTVPDMHINMLCCNEEQIIVGFNLTIKSSLVASTNDCNFYISIDKKTLDFKILEASDKRAEFRIFSFDMSKNIMWWCKKSDDKSKLFLFSTPIQSYEQTIKENHDYSFILPSNYCSDSNFYFNGVLASANDTIHTYFINAEGDVETYSNSFQSDYSSVINGEWLYRKNEGFSLIPYKFGKLWEFDERWEIKDSELEKALEDAQKNF